MFRAAEELRFFSANTKSLDAEVIRNAMLGKPKKRRGGKLVADEDGGLDGVDEVDNQAVGRYGQM